ncbi:MAG: three-Cys-motif partner protein TcmP [Coriobacteriia bacterium]|nr:three-Cys-motif partner protein TcmP [Coriobacteriia bacterium]
MLLSLIDKLGINVSELDDKKEQTTYKIKYVAKYVESWLLVNENRVDVTSINFIDCMCNAGIYKDGDLSTAIEIFKLFILAATSHPEKTFNLLLNDNRAERIEICSQIITEISDGHQPSNLVVSSVCQDVNDYLMGLQNRMSCLGFGSTILYVDPYNLTTVDMKKLSDFLKQKGIYCELLLNLATQHFVRDKDDGRISQCFAGLSIETKDDLLRATESFLRVGAINHVFRYQFHNVNDVELYQIVFATPHLRGLEKLKDAIWEVFKGKEHHRNIKGSTVQTTLWNETEKEDRVSKYAPDACDMLTSHFSGQTSVGYGDIEAYIIENTMLAATHIIQSVLKPLIKDCRIEKINLVGNRNNYHDDKYNFQFQGADE